jgi:hypothetical protein
LDAGYIQQHLAKFEDEVSCLTFENAINTYGQIGRNDGLFIIPKAEMDNLLARTGGDISKIENELGIPDNRWYKILNNPLNQDKLVRIDIKITPNSQLRMPSGNEIGADDLLWIPGGKTFKGLSEAIINPVKVGNTNYIKIVIQ